MTRADDYLRNSETYASAVGGWRWSLKGDAIEYGSGYTLVLTDHLCQVLEGVFSLPSPPSFDHVLHYLSMMKTPPTGTALMPVAASEFTRLAAIIAKVKPSGRNVGLLIAETCPPESRVVDPPSWPEVELAVRYRLLHGGGISDNTFTTHWTVPFFHATEFANTIAERLSEIDDAELEHRLRHGEPPVPGARRLAKSLETFPQRFAALLTAIRLRPRLVGAAVLAPVLDAAIALPARRPQPDRVPQGGYADVTTRGEPERLLPSQFALDPDDFIRRYASANSFTSAVKSRTSRLLRSVDSSLIRE